MDDNLLNSIYPSVKVGIDKKSQQYFTVNLITDIADNGHNLKYDLNQKAPHRILLLYFPLRSSANSLDHIRKSYRNLLQIGHIVTVRRSVPMPFPVL